MVCEDVRAVLAAGEVCEETPHGARVVTHCLYPSFEPVEVFVSRFGDGFLVSDGGGALASGFLHGRDDLTKVATREAARFGVDCRDGVLEAAVPSIDWLRSAILGVANASAAASLAALNRVASSSERALGEKIFAALAEVVPAQKIAKEFAYSGASGKRWHADYAVVDQDDIVLVNAVTPHHVSINSKYVAFSDLQDDRASKFAVFDKRLGSDDTALITQVASLVPLPALAPGVRRAMHLLS